MLLSLPFPPSFHTTPLYLFRDIFIVEAMGGRTDYGNSSSWYILLYFRRQIKLLPCLLLHWFPLNLGSFSLRFVETESLEKEKR